MSEEAAAILFRAAEYIREYGWQVEGMASHGLPRCSMGALASAQPATKWDPRIAKLMYDTLYDELDGISLTTFNHLHQDGEKVIELFETVARRLQSRVLEPAF